MIFNFDKIRYQTKKEIELKRIKQNLTLYKTKYMYIFAIII